MFNVKLLSSLVGMAAAFTVFAVNTGNVSADTTDQSSNNETYTVKSGDSFWKISEKFADSRHESVHDFMFSIASLNHKDINDVIMPEDKLIIPNDGEKATTPVAPAEPVVTTPEVVQPTVQAPATPVQEPVVQPAPVVQTPVTPVQQAPTAPAQSNAVSGSAAEQIAAKTGTSPATWDYIIQRESGYNKEIRNPQSGAYGLFQLLGHGEHDGMTVEEQVAMAADVYNAQGFGAWVVTH